MAVGMETLQCNLERDETTLKFFPIQSFHTVGIIGPSCLQNLVLRGLCKYLERFEICKFYQDKHSLKFAEFYVSS
jgi:hypothetical protein